MVLLLRQQTAVDDAAVLLVLGAAPPSLARGGLSLPYAVPRWTSTVYQMLGPMIFDIEEREARSAG